LALPATGPLRTLVASVRERAGPPAGGDGAVAYELTTGYPPWEPLTAEFAPTATNVAVGAWGSESLARHGRMLSPAPLRSLLAREVLLASRLVHKGPWRAVG
jgi:hypothetical protein